ncbi:MAG: universal stress protein [Actinomycetes bacterium]
MTASSRLPIVVGLDGSDAARGALDWALTTARLSHVAVRMVHAWSVPLPPVAMGPAVSGPSEDALQEVAQTLLDEGIAYAGTVAPDVEVTAELSTTPPASAMITASKDSSMVVLGSRGLGSFTELLVGSVSLQVATHAHCPVAIIRPHTLGEGASSYAGRIVVGVDGSALSTAAAELAFEQASLRGLGLGIVHAWEPPGFDGPGLVMSTDEMQADIEQEQLELVSETVAGLRERFPDVNVKQDLVRGRANSVLVDASRGAELVVVGSRGRGGFASLMLGSVSHTVIHHAHAPVLVVRPGAA